MLRIVGGTHDNLLACLSSHLSIHLQIPYLHAPHPHSDFYVYLKNNNGLVIENSIHGTKIMPPLGSLDFKLLDMARKDGVIYPSVSLVGFPVPKKIDGKLKGRYEADEVTPMFDYFCHHFGDALQTKVSEPSVELTQNPQKFNKKLEGASYKRLRNAQNVAHAHGLSYVSLKPADIPAMKHVFSTWLKQKEAKGAHLDTNNIILYMNKLSNIFENTHYQESKPNAVVRGVRQGDGQLLAIAGIYKYGLNAAHSFRVSHLNHSRAQEYLDVCVMSELQDLGVSCLYLGLESLNKAAGSGLIAYKEQFAPIVREPFLRYKWQFNAHLW